MTAVFAHRGCTESGSGRTRSTPSPRPAGLGADGVELDVRLTADGALAVHHDAEVPGVGPIPELAVAELPRYVPLLADVLAVCEGMIVNVEIKNAPHDPGWDAGEAVAALTAAAIDEAGWTRPGHRLVVPAGHAAGGAGGRRAAGAGRAVGLRDDPGPALGTRPPSGLRAVHPFVLSVTPELVDAGPRTGPGRQRLDGQRPRRPARPWWSWAWTP